MLLLEILVFGISDMDIGYFLFLDLTLLRSEGWMLQLLVDC
jgi:hypothetical protein